MDTGTRIVARLPFKSAGPATLATVSEVATIKFLQRKTSIPIPTILNWSDDAMNDIGSEYIMMNHAAGVKLQQKWPHMAGDEKVKCIEAIYKKLKSMVDIDFPAYGSIYFATTSLPSSSKYALDDDFYVGPHCGTRYWGCGEGRFFQGKNPNQGPWLDLNAYCNGLIDAGLARISPADRDFARSSSYHDSIRTHRDLLERARLILAAISADPRSRKQPDRRCFTLTSTNETCIIDWQSCSIEPAFRYADEEPDFANAATQVTDKTSSLCFQAFNVCTQFLTPTPAAPRLLNEALFRPCR